MTVTVTYNRLVLGGDINGDFQTNTYENGNPLAPDVLGLSGGGFVSAYNNSSLTNGFILLNFYGADHAVIGTHHYPYEDADTDAVGQPKLTELANGNVLMVWDDDNGVQGDAGPQGVIFTAAGDPVLAQTNLLGANGAQPGQVDVGALDDGGFVLTYSAVTNVFFRLYDANGVETLGPTLVNTVIAGTQNDAQVTVLDDGAFAVTWTDTNPADQLIRTRIFEANGDARTAELNVAGIGDNTRSSVAALAGGGYAVAYVDTGWTEAQGISLQIVGPTGFVSSATHVNTSTDTIAETDPDVTVLANGYIAVTWTTPVGAEDGQITCRIFDNTGAAVMDEFSIAASGNDEVASAVSALLDGYFITSWQDETPDTNGGSIASQITEIVRTVVGDAGADDYDGDELRDSMDGGDGLDTLRGGDGADTLHGGGDGDVVFGDAGADVVQGGLGGDTVYGGEGNDRVYAGTEADPHSSLAGDLLYGDYGVDRVRGAAGGDTMYGGFGDDKLNGGAGADLMYGDAGDNKSKGQSGNDTLYGGWGVDTLNGGVGDDNIYAGETGCALNGANGHDTLAGWNGNDTIVGLAGKDVITGGDGEDVLSGGALKDLITGGQGADTMAGGSDKDTFAYVTLLDSANGDEDLITDLGNLDVIDLSAIDARTGPGDHAFELVAAFTGDKGQLVVAYHASGGYAGLTTIQGDVNGDGAADFTITVTGDKHVFDNFVL